MLWERSWRDDASAGLGPAPGARATLLEPLDAGVAGGRLDLEAGAYDLLNAEAYELVRAHGISVLDLTPLTMNQTTQPGWLAGCTTGATRLAKAKASASAGPD